MIGDSVEYAGRRALDDIQALVDRELFAGSQGIETPSTIVLPLSSYAQLTENRMKSKNKKKSKKVGSIFDGITMTFDTETHRWSGSFHNDAPALARARDIQGGLAKKVGRKDAEALAGALVRATEKADQATRDADQLRASVRRRVIERLTRIVEIGSIEQSLAAVDKLVELTKCGWEVK